MHNHIESVHYTPDHTLRYILFDQKYIEIKQLRNTPLTTEQVEALFSPDIPDIKDRLVCKYASPYCGITGFNSMKELQEIGSEFDRLKIFGMFGLLVSWRQCAWAGLNASEEEKKKTKDWVDPRYVPIDQLHDFCAYAHSHGLAMIHYNTINEKFASELIQLIDTYHLESVLDGFQLNFRFLPDPAELHALVTRYPSLTFIYQLRPITMIES